MLLACAGGGEMRPTITPELRAETLELLEARPPRRFVRVGMRRMAAESGAAAFGLWS